MGVPQLSPAHQGQNASIEPCVSDVGNDLPVKVLRATVRPMSEPTNDTHPAVSRFAKRLRRAREAEGLSLSVVAQTVQTSQQYLSLVERGERDPDFSLVARLTVLFKLDLPAVVYGQKVAGTLDDTEEQPDVSA